MDEGSLGVHKIEFVINSGEDLSDGSRVGDLSDGELLVVSFLGGDNWGIRRKHEMDS